MTQPTKLTHDQILSGLRQVQEAYQAWYADGINGYGQFSPADHSEANLNASLAQLPAIIAAVEAMGKADNQRVGCVYSLRPTDGSTPGDYLIKDGFVVAQIFPGKSNDRGGEAKRICSAMNATWERDSAFGKPPAMDCPWKCKPGSSNCLCRTRDDSAVQRFKEVNAAILNAESEGE